MMNVSDDVLYELFTESELLFLPYNAAGGYSAVMNVGALYGMRMVAYDIPELREFRNVIGPDCEFVDTTSRKAVKTTLINSIGKR